MFWEAAKAAPGGALRARRTPALKALRSAAILSACAAFAMVFWISLVADGPPNQPLHHDFEGFWAAARLAITKGPAHAYHPLELVQTEGLGEGFYAFLYPPPFLLLAAPFALLSTRLALALWRIASLAAFGIAARALRPANIWIAAFFPAVWLSLIGGQSGALMAALFAGAAVLLERRPFLAGLLLGAMICKPQLWLLAPVALVAERRRGVLAGAAVSSLGLMALSLILFGPDAFAAFWRVRPLALMVLNAPDLWPKMVGLYPALRLAGIGEGAAWTAQIALAGGCAGLVWRVWRGQAAPLAKMSVLALCGLLASPYAFGYDLGLLIVPVTWLLSRDQPALNDRIAAWSLTLLPLIAPLIGMLTGLNLASAGLALATAMVIWRVQAAEPCNRVSPPVSPGPWTPRGPFFGFCLPTPGRSRGRASSRPGVQGTNPPPRFAIKPPKAKPTDEPSK